jgi:hypothetical protein
MAASLVGPGAVQADATAAHPSKQLGHRRPPPGPGSTAALRVGSRDPAPRDLPTDLGWPGSCRQPLRVHPAGPSPSATPRPTVAANSTWEENPGRRQPTPPDHSAPDRGCGEAEKSLPWVVGERCEHGAVETLWQTPRRRCQSDGARLRRTPNLRPGPLHRPALPVQPRSALRDPPRVGPAAGNSAATPHPKLLGDRWSPPHGGCFNVATCAATGDLHHSAGMPLLTPLGTARTAVLCSVYRAEFLSI